MPLDPEDVQAIGQLLDERLGAYDQRQRARRRWWLWFWIVLFIVSTIASWVTVQRVIEVVMSKATAMMDKVDAEERDFAQAKAVYQKQVAHDQQMQKERADAEQAAHYESKQSKAEYEAGLIRQSLAVFAKSAKAQEKVKNLGASNDPDDDLKALEELSGTLSQGTNVLMQVLLRNTDPAHDSAQERLEAGADEGHQPSAADPGMDSAVLQKFEELQRQLAATLPESETTAPDPVKAPAHDQATGTPASTHPSDPKTPRSP